MVDGTVAGVAVDIVLDEAVEARLAGDREGEFRG
jgi:hypothetical protein